MIFCSNSCLCTDRWPSRQDQTEDTINRRTTFCSNDHLFLLLPTRGRNYSKAYAWLQCRTCSCSLLKQSTAQAITIYIALNRCPYLSYHILFDQVLMCYWEIFAFHRRTLSICLAYCLETTQQWVRPFQPWILFKDIWHAYVLLTLTGPRHVGVVAIAIHSASNLKITDLLNQTSDPYVSISFMKSASKPLFSTRIHFKDLNPVF